MPINPSLPWLPGTNENSTHKGNCHCGAISYTVTISPPLPPSTSGVMKPSEDNNKPDQLTATTLKTESDTTYYRPVRCNCSICTRNGYLLIYPLKADVIWQPDDSEQKLRKYFAATKRFPHLFCGECGSSIGCDLSGLGALMGTDEKQDRLGLNVSASLHFIKGGFWELMVPLSSPCSWFSSFCPASWTFSARLWIVQTWSCL